MPSKRTKKDGETKRRKPQTDTQDLEQRGDELEVFERRVEWFRELFADRTGIVPAEGRRQALRQAARLGRTRLREFDPGGPRPQRGPRRAP